MLNIDFVAIITQFSINCALLVGLGIYLVCTFSWESSSKQEEEAAKQFHEMRANLKDKQGASSQDDNSAHESLLPPDESEIMGNNMGRTQFFEFSAIAPNMTNIQGVNANMRAQQRHFMQETMNNSGACKCLQPCSPSLFCFACSQRER